MKLLNTKYFLLILLFFVAPQLHAQWLSQTSNVTGKLSDVYFINENTGWICGDNVVLKTTNSGANWEKTNLPGVNNSISFLNSQTGFVAANNGKLYKTINGGTNWELINLSVTVNLNKVKFLNNNFGVVIGNKTKAFKTTNGGANWTSISIGTDSLDILDIKILNENRFVATGIESMIWFTDNGGQTWHAHFMGMPNPLFAVDFINENTGMVSGCCGMLMRTTNGGVSWSPEVYLTPGYSVHSLKFITLNKIFIAADAGYIFRTSNNGMNWDSLVAPNNNDIYGMHFVNENTGWLTGMSGTILKTTNGGGTGFPIGINQISSEIPDKFSLHQNYPNPFNPSTNIGFEIPDFGFYEMKVYDISGKLVETLMSQNLTAGTYEIIWNAADFPSGVYFYTLRSNKFSETKRMVLLK